MGQRDGFESLGDGVIESGNESATEGGIDGAANFKSAATATVSGFNYKRWSQRNVEQSTLVATEMQALVVRSKNVAGNYYLVFNLRQRITTERTTVGGCLPIGTLKWKLVAAHAPRSTSIVDAGSKRTRPLYLPDRDVVTCFNGLAEPYRKLYLAIEAERKALLVMASVSAQMDWTMRDFMHRGGDVDVFDAVLKRFTPTSLAHDLWGGKRRV